MPLQAIRRKNSIALLRVSSSESDVRDRWRKIYARCANIHLLMLTPPAGCQADQLALGHLRTRGSNAKKLHSAIYSRSARRSTFESSIPSAVEKVNRFFKQWIKMLEDEIREKEQTIVEIMARLDMHDEKVSNRIESKEYQSLLKKTFREWSGAESEDKRTYIRNILANAAACTLVSDDVVRLFIDWLAVYSELHFKVIAVVYRHSATGISRGRVWKELGKARVAENAADADLFKLLFRDLSTGGVIRQHREVDYYGNFIAKAPERRPKGSGPKPMTSAFDEEDLYELTELGSQFVHYAMTDLPLKIEYKPQQENV